MVGWGMRQDEITHHCMVEAMGKVGAGREIPPHPHAVHAVRWPARIMRVACCFAVVRASHWPGLALCACPETSVSPQLPRRARIPPTRVLAPVRALCCASLLHMDPTKPDSGELAGWRSPSAGSMHGRTRGKPQCRFARRPSCRCFLRMAHCHCALAPSPTSAAELDLHTLSVMGMRTVLRGWLLALRHWARRGVRMTSRPTFGIITGERPAA